MAPIAAPSVMEFWYDFASPYSYIAAARIERLTSDTSVSIEWRPFLLGPIFKRRSGGVSAFQNPDPSERRYRRRDVERLCERYGLPLQWPSVYPRGSLLATRVALLAADEGWCSEFTLTVFRASFCQDRDIGSQAVVQELLEALGKDAATILVEAGSDFVKGRLAAQVETAIAQEIFGAPSFVTKGELFWGSDRLEQAIEWCASTV
ncbi:2-hydroxychromene-2-carboxylate isomerase [Variovorax sp. J22R24]|uniref:2-hydroxychromene-2-carboxylate isomerase n=1 Tax=Variovorax gracilis TaxID=3053502 RepID=UPI0025780694|nr:2-hydroxychromene-2-carboxylate isomerase [Variovorax sp. J22R24]MDM0109463.1 2-hydroxychromene-2-carboxylate isomerase [Variovorax sp. J22R24]